MQRINGTAVRAATVRLRRAEDVGDASCWLRVLREMERREAERARARERVVDDETARTLARVMVGP